MPTLPKRQWSASPSTRCARRDARAWKHLVRASSSSTALARSAGSLGGRLFEHGHDVVLIARGAHREVDRRKRAHGGLSGRGGHASGPGRRTPASARLRRRRRRRARDEEPGHRRRARRPRNAARRRRLPIVCAQNGVENERVALRRFDNVYGMCVMCPATHLEPGRVEASSSPVTGLMDLGRWPTGADARCRARSPLR